MNNADARVLGLDLLCLFLAADQSRQLPGGMSVGNGIKAIATNITRSTSSVEFVRSVVKLAKGADLQEDLGRSHIAMGHDGDECNGGQRRVGLKQRL